MKKMFITEEEINELGLTKQEKNVLLNEPKLGISTNESGRAVPYGETGESSFQIPVIKQICEQSCFSNSNVEEGDSIISINGYIVEAMGGEIRFVNPQGEYATEDFFVGIRNGSDVEIDLIKPKKVSTRNPMMAMIPQAITLERTQIIQRVYPIYEVKDKKLQKKISKLKVSGLPQRIKNRVFAQDKAIETINKSLKIYFSGLKDQDKPIGSYLLVGPTGTGKTEVAKLYSKFLGFNFVRIDMSEFVEKHNVSRLLGAPPSYIGYGEPTVLEKEIGAEGKQTVLLLDEVEKAHPDIHKVFLQAMDNGLITLGDGKKVDLTNTLILMTSNLGISQKSSLGIAREDKRLSLDMEKIRSFFPPEFIGRLSGVAEFNALSEDQAIQILEKFVSEFNYNLKIKKGAVIELSSEAKDFLVEKGFSKLYGARPLKNILQGEVYEKIADLYLSLEDIEETDKIQISVEKGEIKASFKEQMSLEQVN